MRSFLPTTLLALAIAAPAAADESLPDGEGRDVAEYACSQCHDLRRVTDARKSEAKWRYLVTQMLNQGAPIEDYEVDTVIRYLADYFGEE